MARYSMRGYPDARSVAHRPHRLASFESQGLDWYREDLNGGNATGRLAEATMPMIARASTENLYIQGHLAFWDELRRRHPALRIDSCASGGRRNDLETMRRAVPLLRNDFQHSSMPGVIEGNQGHRPTACPFGCRGRVPAFTSPTATPCAVFCCRASASSRRETGPARPKVALR